MGRALAFVGRWGLGWRIKGLALRFELCRWLQKRGGVCVCIGSVTFLRSILFESV